MLKQSAKNVLASFRPSTCPRGYASTLHSLRLCRTACLSIPRECALAAPHVGAIGVLLCQNDFSVVCEVWNCCYRSFASVASNVFILVKMFSSPASLGTIRADRAGTIVAYARTSQRGTDWNPQWTGLSL